MIGRFPWDPFPAGEPEGKGPDPLHNALYRAAVAGADSYRATRQVLRRERGVLRVGNRFVAENRYRQVGFLAVGHAASSMALAALDALGDRLTQGFVAGPDPPPSYVPFHSVVVPDGWGPAASAPRVLEAAREISVGLRENDLFLVLVSPGASRSLLAPSDSMSGEELGRRLREAYEQGASGAEVTDLARALGGGGVGGRLLPAGIVADVQTLAVERGDGAARSGGGPTVPIGPTERTRTGELIGRLGWDRSAGLSVETPGGSEPLESGRRYPDRRPVVVAGPSDALRAAADLAFDKGWTSRIGGLLLSDRPEAAADRIVLRSEELLAESRRAGPSRSKGLVTVAMATLDVPDGVSEEPACRTFLGRAASLLKRRELSVGLYRTAGPLGSDPKAAAPGAFSGAVVGAPTDPEARVPPGAARALRMRPGITDVGLLAVAVLLPSPADTATGTA